MKKSALQYFLTMIENAIKFHEDCKFKGSFKICLKNMQPKHGSRIINYVPYNKKDAQTEYNMHHDRNDCSIHFDIYDDFISFDYRAKSHHVHTFEHFYSVFINKMRWNDMNVYDYRLINIKYHIVPKVIPTSLNSHVIINQNDNIIKFYNKETNSGITIGKNYIETTAYNHNIYDIISFINLNLHEMK